MVGKVQISGKTPDDKQVIDKSLENSLDETSVNIDLKGCVWYIFSSLFYKSKKELFFTE